MLPGLIISSALLHSSVAVAAQVSVSLAGKTYINKGLVAFGRIPSNALESTGDTIGGIGSAIALKLGTWKATATGTFTGTFVVHPDRGFNVEQTIDYQARQFELDFVLQPYYGNTSLTWASAQNTFNLTYKRTILQTDRAGVRTTGLDALGVRAAQSGFPTNQAADPEMPIPATSNNHVSIDAEGIVANADGSYWVSDEYGPYIYRFDAYGTMTQVIQPPKAVLPLDEDGKLVFTSDGDPNTGREGNKGFEGLAIDRKTQTLYAILQSALIQDGGGDSDTSRYTRLFAYNISSTTTRPALVGEWVVPLPQSSKGKTLDVSEIHFVSPGVFLALSRDGDGRSGDDIKSKYKQIDLFSIANATDIHGTKYDDPANPVAEDGELTSSVKAATYVSFVNILATADLSKFGLHNDSPDDITLIAAKWESLAVASVNDPAFPDDYFLFTAADNDFISTQGVSLGVKYNAGLDVDNQWLVYRVTLPGYQN